MQRLQRTASTATVMAELSHVFCCGLPVLAAVLSVGSQAGLGGAFLGFHEVMHDWEVTLLIGSGMLLVAGLGLQIVSFQLDCRATGCGHEPCEPKKLRISRLFKVAIVLYAANITFYVLSGHM